MAFIKTLLLSLLGSRPDREVAPPPLPPAPRRQTVAVTLPPADELLIAPLPTGPETFDCSALMIEYIDAAGSFSRRRISIQSAMISEGGNSYFRAFCHERQAQRSFRADRVRRAFDLGTGEIYEPPGPYLDQLMSAFSPGVKEFFSRSGAGANILAFLARADGRWDDAETRTMLNWAIIEAQLSPGWGPRDMETLRFRLERLHPTAEVYARSLQRITRWSQARLRVLAGHALELIEADGSVDDKERELLARVTAVLAEKSAPRPRKKAAPTT